MRQRKTLHNNKIKDNNCNYMDSNKEQIHVKYKYLLNT